MFSSLQFGRWQLLISDSNQHTRRKCRISATLTPSTKCRDLFIYVLILNLWRLSTAAPFSLNVLMIVAWYVILVSVVLSLFANVGLGPTCNEKNTAGNVTTSIKPRFTEPPKPDILLQKTKRGFMALKLRNWKWNYLRTGKSDVNNCGKATPCLLRTTHPYNLLTYYFLLFFYLILLLLLFFIHQISNIITLTILVI